MRQVLVFLAVAILGSVGLVKVVTGQVEDPHSAVVRLHAMLDEIRAEPCLGEGCFIEGEPIIDLDDDPPSALRELACRVEGCETEVSESR